MPVYKDWSDIMTLIQQMKLIEFVDKLKAAHG